MKLKFKQQDFQTDAVNAVCDLFDGQKASHAVFGLDSNEDQLSCQGEFGFGNRLLLTDDELLANMHYVQRRNGIVQTDNLAGNQFSIEMETGTGKTYVYTKTIYELHKQYGFTKFIIVVPSVAIREGVNKSLQMTEDHFGALYNNAPCRYFIYNSAKLSDVRQFATSTNIEIMIINIDAFRKAENVINQKHDRLGGEAAIRYIQDTHPIVIIDEPQSVDNTVKAKDAIASLHPLCVFRYSATHRERINLLYRLTPVDAFQMGLVKQICVSSNQIAGGFNRPYIRLLSVSHDGGFRARIELDVANKKGVVSRKQITVKQNADLYKLSGNRGLYEGYTVTGIDCTPGGEQIELSGVEYLALGKAIGDIDENLMKRMQIRRTIEAHLDKELRYTKLGVKVLSLFFIDEVKKYRDADGGKGIYAQMFEEQYAELISLPKYAPLTERFPVDPESVHDGYFSQDKKGNYKNTRGDTQDDYSTYNTIMRDKEWLLSFDCPLRFIFSHSALKEGWDNPNVFQVCTLIDQKSTLTARQKVGRGLRLCVDQNGDRIEDRNINLLHVMANESFSEFASTLQKEIEDETGVKFGYLQMDMFSGLSFEETKTETAPLTEDQVKTLMSHLAHEGFLTSGDYQPKDELELLPKELEAARIVAIENIAREGSLTAAAISSLTATTTVVEHKTISQDSASLLMEHLGKQGYITGTGQIKESLNAAIQHGTLTLPAHLENARTQIISVIRRANRKPVIHDASNQVTVHRNKEVLASPEFLALWDRIKQKTVYRVHINDNILVDRCVEQISAMETIPKAKVITQLADIHVDTGGVSFNERAIRTHEVQDDYTSLPNLLSIIGEQTLTKRATICEILKKSSRLKDFLNNPQLFMETVTQIILGVRRELAVDGIEYVKLNGQDYYAQQIFDNEELIAYLDRNAVPVEHSVYDHIIYDSPTVEKPFAEALDDDPDVKMFLKLPDKFKVDTPIGTYNPDWAVYMDIDGNKMLYLVIETKGSSDQQELRSTESMKIRCGKAHFLAIDTGAELFGPVNDWKQFKVGKI